MGDKGERQTRDKEKQCNSLFGEDTTGSTECENKENLHKHTRCTSDRGRERVTIEREREKKEKKKGRKKTRVRERERDRERQGDR